MLTSRLETVNRRKSAAAEQPRKAADMRFLANVSFLVRGAIAALVFMIAGALLIGLASISPEPRSAEALAAATELHPASLTGSIISVAVSGDTAILGGYNDDEAGAT